VVGRRLIARVLDQLAVLTLQMMLTLTMLQSPLTDRLYRREPEPWRSSFGPIVVYASLTLVYEVVFVAARGQTPGKDVMKVRVERNGRNALPSRWRATVRSLPAALVWLIPGIWRAETALVVLALPALIGPGRAVHDWLAATCVVAFDADAVEGPVQVVKARSRPISKVSRRLSEYIGQNPEDVHDVGHRPH
jgi:uncharacterized RDD family membrane protein YckC